MPGDIFIGGDQIGGAEIVSSGAGVTSVTFLGDGNFLVVPNGIPKGVVTFKGEGKLLDVGITIAKASVTFLGKGSLVALPKSPVPATRVTFEGDGNFLVSPVQSKVFTKITFEGDGNFLAAPTGPVKAKVTFSGTGRLGLELASEALNEGPLVTFRMKAGHIPQHPSVSFGIRFYRKEYLTSQIEITTKDEDVKQGLRDVGIYEEIK